MKLYSDFGPRRSRQIVADVTALALIGAWVWLGITVYSLIENLAVCNVSRLAPGGNEGFERIQIVGDGCVLCPHLVDMGGAGGSPGRQFVPEQEVFAVVMVVEPRNEVAEVASHRGGVLGV